LMSSNRWTVATVIAVGAVVATVAGVF